ncbi:hypothetical protein Desor_1571 [Desulfosporosinus orientis DSM 765]|uniref:Uncharacterized protein n=1 Tax=Desulfosporosinus orientis (strain ATCC 19365 / DSM 765 / NCIMB 8382 / VKM B-1628 / Singapore I) TaxID=768706 RepID=G7WD25_DESOD|nr:hypothetical protein [Desulfosporosinus orientis]AET67220.1 hypothetical protein Desor_1571 [Desulfosporosinus orientis DSM 765]
MRARNIVTVAVIILLVGGFISFAGFNRLHAPIFAIQVQKIVLWGEPGYEIIQREATGKEAENIVKWFNESTDIRENKYFSGETPAAGIIINLIFAPDVLILRSGGDFEVQRNNWLGIRKSY